MPQSFALTAYLVKLFLRTELSGVPVGSTHLSIPRFQSKTHAIKECNDAHNKRMQADAAKLRR